MKNILLIILIILPFYVFAQEGDTIKSIGGLDVFKIYPDADFFISKNIVGFQTFLLADSICQSKGMRICSFMDWQNAARIGVIKASIEPEWIQGRVAVSSRENCLIFNSGETDPKKELNFRCCCKD